MKKTKVTRSLLAAMSIVALSAVMYGCVHSSDDPPAKTPEEMCTADGGTWADGQCTTAEDKAAELLKQQRAAITTAIGAAQTAVNAVGNGSTNAEVSAADTAIANARSAIADAANVPAEEKAANTGTVNALAAQLDTAKTARQTAIDAAQDAADKVMMATAMKLHKGISAPGGSETSTRTAAYAGDGDSQIAVTIGTANPVNLSEDKKTTVAAHMGWAGKRYTAEPTGGGTYEARVYSNIGKPTQGDKFGQVGVTTAATGYEYGLNANGILTGTNVEATANRVASSRFDQSAGVKSFELGTNRQYVSISGSYHGVSGEYRCTPGDNNKCAAQVAAEGFNLGGVTAANEFSADNAEWTFKPSNPEARVMSAADANYASYGWWLHTEADGDLVASAFHDFKGTAGTVEISALRGTATYKGGAAGKYALYSSTGGTNDAGHFTATATLTATFADDHKVFGTIDNFMGVGGAKNWSVELKEAVIADDGSISRTAADDTVWTIDGRAAAASGEWLGNLREEGDDGVPSVATGTFYSTYGNDGRMVGAFGANKQ